MPERYLYFAVTPEVVGTSILIAKVRPPILVPKRQTVEVSTEETSKDSLKLAAHLYEWLVAFT